MQFSAFIRIADRPEMSTRHCRLRFYNFTAAVDRRILWVGGTIDTNYFVALDSTSQTTNVPARSNPLVSEQGFPRLWHDSPLRFELRRQILGIAARTSYQTEVPHNRLRQEQTTAD